MTLHPPGRRQAILGTGAALMMTASGQAQAADGDFAARLADLQRNGRVMGLDALLVSLKGRTLFEYYGEGEAENWGATPTSSPNMPTSHASRGANASPLPTCSA